MKKMLVVLESGPGGNLNREPRFVIPASLSDDTIRAIMKHELEAEPDTAFVEDHPRHFKRGAFDRFELKEVFIPKEVETLIF